MKLSEEGIILSRKSFSESSIILHLFSQHHGQQHLIFQGYKKKGQALFPLAWVRYSYYQRNDSSLAKFTEFEHVLPLHDIVNNPLKSSLAFFIAELVEILSQVNHEDQKLYAFISQEIKWLNESNELSNYLIWFLAKITQIEGFQPEIKSENPIYFDLQEGVFTNESPILPAYLKESWLHWMVDALQQEKNTFLAFAIPKEERLHLVNAWLNYYDFHVSKMRQLKSLQVIRTVFYE